MQAAVGAGAYAVLDYISTGSAVGAYKRGQRVGSLLSSRKQMPYIPNKNNFFTPYNNRMTVGPFRSNQIRSANITGLGRIIKRKRNFTGRKSFKKRVVDVGPAKHFTVEQGQALTHNTVLSAFPTNGPAHGTTNTTRIGDEIYLCGLKIKGMFNSGTASGAYSYRILVGWTGEEYVSTGLGANLTGGEVFLPTTFNTWGAAGLVNPKAFTVLYDETLDINSLVASTIDLSSFSINVNLGNKIFPYQGSGSALGKNKNLAIVVVSSVANGAVGVTSTGGISFTYDLIYK